MRNSAETVADPASNRDSGVVDWCHIDRTVVVLATSAAGLFFVILTAGWLLTGDDSLLKQSVAPLAVGSVGVVMLALGRPRPLAQIAVGAIGLIVFVTVSESDVPGSPLIGLLVMSIMATLLTHRYVGLVVTVAASALAVTGWAWHPADTPANDRAVMAFSLVVTFGLTAWLLHYLKRQSTQSRERLQELIGSKDDFLATVSHELRTPLTGVVGISRELRDRWTEFSQQEIDQMVGDLVAQSTDAADIVEDLLVTATARVGEVALDLRVVDLQRAVEAAIPVGLDVAVDSPSDSVMVVADPPRLRQIVRNLASNAVRYGGEAVRVVVSGDDSTGFVEVRDNGLPLSSRDRKRIFDAYHSAGALEGRPGSVGLGLTVSRRLARLMEGDVDYRHDGRESVFRLILPRSGWVMGAKPAHDEAADGVTLTPSTDGRAAAD